MYISNNVAERIKATAKSKGISVKKILEDANLGFNTMSNMKTSMPKADNLAKIADHLDCSVDFLLGRTDVLETKIEYSLDDSNNKNLNEYIALSLTKLSDSELAFIQEYIKRLLLERKK